ncbi:glycosyltransferase family 4 protein [Vibrio splendidus]|uniref:glycosyltransferase family 4 protein n=1 Tax=Vibrio splendidus TaxID=29497 RepID=UPI000D3344EB|nr:glycosyltransferase family 4 protein [Vibrio splendidus]PTO75711.1 glycosyltransferase family 4 protein [Vibrio splendidus]
MKNIAFVIGSASDNGGVERVLYNLVSIYQADNYNITVINLFGGRKEDSFLKNKNIKFVNLYEARVSLFYWFCYIKKLRKTLLDNDIDLVFDMGSHLSMFSVPASLCIKTKVISCEHVNLKVSKKNLIIKVLFARFADKLITLTNKDKKWYEKFFLKNVICIPNFTTISAENYKPIADRDNTIIAVGRLCYQKSFDRLIDIWSKSEVKERFTLEIWGDGEDRSYLAGKIESLGLNDSCKLMGESSNLEPIYGNAKCLLMTSRYEGYPMVLIESLVSGTPIISYNCDTGPEEIIIDGKNGFLIDEGDDCRFLLALEKYCNDNQLQSKIFEYVVDNNYIYTKESKVSLWLKLANDCIKK